MKTVTVLASASLVLVSTVASAAPAARRATLPARPAPLISTTSGVAEYQAAEVRLAQFIRALQRDRRQRAAQLLSSRVTAEERRALLEGRWLSRAAGRNAFEQVLFLPDLQIRTREIQPNSVKLTVIPRVFKPKKQKTAGPTGYLEVRMRKERGKWWVEMHPEQRLSNAR